MRNSKFIGCIICIICTVCVALNLIIPGRAIAVQNAVPSMWEAVTVSLTDLLNSGWQLTGVTSNRSAYQNTFNPGGFDERTHGFLLTKDRKYVMCFALNPAPPVTNIGCRKLN
jgi:hypothetical protein